MKQYTDALTQKVCRLCLKDGGKLLSIFKKSTPSIAQRIMDCTKNIQVQVDDGFPALICASCLRKLNKAHKFIKNCERSYEILKNSLQTDTKVKQECEAGYDEQNDEKWSLSDDECITIYYSELKPKVEENLAASEKKNDTLLSEEFAISKIKEESENIEERENIEELLASGNIELQAHSPSIAEGYQSDVSFKSELNDNADFCDTIEENTHNDQEKKVLKIHRVKAIPEKCPDCGILYKSRQFLLRHIKIRHAAEVYQEYVKTHQVQDKPFVCSTCDSCFSQKASLKSHLLTHVKDRPYQCDICNKGFKQVSGLTVHQRIHSDTRPFKCDTCPRAFRNSRHLHFHKKIHLGIRDYICSECGKGFIKDDHLINHLRTHSAERAFSCEFCGKSFKSRSYMKVHRKIHIDKTNRKCSTTRRNRAKAVPEKCHVCNKLYQSAEYLLQHMKDKHSGPAYQEYMETHTHTLKERPHICSECGKAFTQQCYLAIHQRTHSQDKPFECEVCHKRFVQNGNLYVHMRMHTDQRKYKCEVCNKAFRAPHHLKFHLKIHSGEKDYICTHCKKGFRKPEHLTQHMRTHTGEKPYNCDICGKMYSSSSVLRTHLFTHKGLKPFICKYCNRAFNQKSSMYRHMLTHRNDPEGKIRRRNKIIESDGEEPQES